MQDTLPEQSPPTQPFMRGLHQPVGVAVMHLTYGFPGWFCQALGAALPGQVGGAGGTQEHWLLEDFGHKSTAPSHPYIVLCTSLVAPM